MNDLLQRLQANQNDVRNQAEVQFNTALKNDVRTVMNELLQVVLIGTDVNLCNASAVLFRGQLVKSKGSEWWESLSEAERDNLRSVLLQRLRSAESSTLKRHVSNIVAQVARMSFEGEDKWPTLLNELAQMSIFDGDDGSLSSVSAATIGEMTRVCPGKIDDAATLIELHNLMSKIMQEPPKGNNNARIEAVMAMAGIIGLAEDEHIAGYEPGVLAMLNAVQFILKDNDMMLKWLEAVIEAINMQPKLFLSSGKGLVKVMVDISNNAEQSEDVRKQALEVCLAIATEVPMVLKEDEGLTRALFEVCVMFMLTSDDDPDDIEDGRVEGAAEEENLCDAGARGVFFVSESLGEARTLPILFPMVESLLQPSGDWRRERAGLLALMRSVYRSGKMMYEHLGEVLTRMLPFVVNENTIVKVRLVALDALSLFFIVFGDPDDVNNMFIDENEIDGERLTDDDADHPNIQKLFGEQLLGAISSVLSEPTANSAAQWALRAKGAKALSHFCFPFEDGNGADILGPKAHELLNKLYRLVELSGAVQMQHRQQHGLGYVQDSVDLAEVQCNALDAVGTMAKALGPKFIDYYDLFMPMAQKVYEVQEEVVATGAKTEKKDKQASAWTEKQVNLRGTALEAISYMGVAVGKEKFNQDAARLIQMITSYMTNFWDQGDLERNRQVAELAANICTTMGHVEKHILDELIPRLIKWAQIEVFSEASEADLESDEDSEDEEAMYKSYVRTEEGALLCVNTFHYREKENAVRILRELINGIEKDVMPWAAQLGELFIGELSRTYPSPDLQMLSAASLSRLLRAMSSFLKSQPSIDPTQVAFAQQLFENSLNTCLVALANSLHDAAEEDEERMEEAAMGKEFEDDEDDSQLLITQLANHVTNMLRISFESGGRSDFDADYVCAPEFTNEARPPLFAVQLNDVRALMVSLSEIMKDSCNRPRGNPWWKETNNQELLDLLSESVGLLLKTHGQPVFNDFAEIILPFGYKLLDLPVSSNGGVTAAMQAVGLFFLDDAITYCKPASNVLVPKAVQYFIQHSNARNFVLRQAAVFGIGLAVEDGGAAFEPFLEPATNALVQCIDAPNARKGNNASATENALSSLLKVALVRNQWGVLPKVLANLPCKVDLQEARVVHYRLFAALRDGHPQFAPFVDQVKQILLAANAEKTGWNPKTETFEAEYSVLSDQTRAWINANLVGR